MTLLFSIFIFFVLYKLFGKYLSCDPFEDFFGDKKD